MCVPDVKFLVDRRGVPVKRFKPGFDPLDFESDVSAYITPPIASQPCVNTSCVHGRAGLWLERVHSHVRKLNLSSVWGCQPRECLCACCACHEIGPLACTCERLNHTSYSPAGMGYYSHSRVALFTIGPLRIGVAFALWAQVWHDGLAWS